MFSENTAQQTSKFQSGLSLPDVLWQFQKTCQFTDLVLTCSDGVVPAHKAMMVRFFTILGIEIGQEEIAECLILDTKVEEVEQALEQLYLKSESTKLMNIFCCTKVKLEIVNHLSLVEVKPENPSDDECLSTEQFMEDGDALKQEYYDIEMDNEKDTKSMRKNAQNPLNAKNPNRPKHLERIKSLSCDKCDHIARDAARLQKHKRFNHDNLKHQCDYCDFRTTFHKDNEIHRNEVHPEWKILKKLKKITCDECDFVAKRPERLAGHKKREHGEKYPCDECDKTYMNPDKLEVHKKYAHDKSIRQCDQCPFQTNCKWSLRNHIRVKHTDQEFYCDQCDFSSHTKGSLKNHVESKHEGRRFYCEKCEYSAPYNGGLLRHIKMVHERITYQCDFCEHKATTKSNLRLHSDAKHFGIKYPCDLCDYKASQPGSLKIHKQSKHVLQKS